MAGTAAQTLTRRARKGAAARLEHDGASQHSIDMLGSRARTDRALSIALASSFGWLANSRTPRPFSVGGFALSICRAFVSKAAGAVRRLIVSSNRGPSRLFAIARRVLRASVAVRNRFMPPAKYVSMR